LNTPLIVPADLAGQPLDEFLALHYPRIGKGRLRRMVRDGRITLDGIRVLPGARVGEGQVILIDVEPQELDAPNPGNLPVALLHEDTDFVAVDKPAGIPVEPSRWGEHPLHLSGTLLSWAEDAKREDGAITRRPRGLHRLDIGTSGVVLYALNLEAERHARGLFERGEVRKTYHALVLGEVRDAGEVNLALTPDPRQEGRMIGVAKGGKASLTVYEPLEIFRGFTLLKVMPKTGRTHQIRVHLASIGHPLAVDSAYGGGSDLRLSKMKRGYRPKKGREEKPLITRTTLHAARLEWNGLDGATIAVEAPWPADFSLAIKQMRRWRVKSV